MTEDRRERATEAASRLADAVRATRASDEWPSKHLHVFDVVQASVARWAQDTATTFAEYADALGEATASPDREEVPNHDPVSALEESFMRAVGVRDRLRSLAALVVGSRCLRLDGPGVSFEPNERDLRRRLGDLAEARMRRAGAVKTLFEQVADHPAIRIRNDVLHALAPFPELVETCWINKVRLDERGNVKFDGLGPLYPAGTLDHDDASPMRLYRSALETSEEAFELLVRLTTELATLIEELGDLQMPPSVYVTHDGSALLERP